jgi:hypothetical protein
LLKYKEPRKLKVLVANDDDFSLMLVASNFERIHDVDKIFKASNG